MSIKLKDFPFDEVFYWKGKKYKQFIRCKFKVAPIVCYEFPQGEYLEMPPNRKVKPVLKINTTNPNT